MFGPITLAVEGDTDVAVARRLLVEVGLESGPEYIKNGKAELDRSLVGYNNAARFSCWLVLRDLDQDARCAPELCLRLLPDPSARMRLHVPVRAIEAWFLADSEAFRRYFSISGKIPADPETIPYPKRTLIDLARKSRRRAIREALVPVPGSTAQVGPGYAASLIEFTTAHWRPRAAAARSASLERLLHFLRGAARKRG